MSNITNPGERGRFSAPRKTATVLRLALPERKYEKPEQQLAFALNFGQFALYVVEPFESARCPKDPVAVPALNSLSDDVLILRRVFPLVTDDLAGPVSD